MASETWHQLPGMKMVVVGSVYPKRKVTPHRALLC